MKKKIKRTWMVAMALCLASTTLAAAERDVHREHARSAPQWLRDGVIYEIFPRGFSREGNFNGITARLDELQDLGVNILWLMPIHPIGEQCRKGEVGSPYSISDYYAIDPNYGTTNDLKRLIAEAHKRDLKVILDLVANHTSWDSVMMTHPEFYKQDAHGKIVPPVPEWTDVAGLNYRNPALRQYMIAMMKHYITAFDLDGYRCDVAPMVPTDFWEQARVELEKVKPDIMMLAEASKPELLVKAFDVDYAWPLHSTLNRVLLEGAPASDFKNSWEESLKKFPKGSLHMRISDNHDEARAVARFGVRGALAAQVLMMTLDGVPLLYNGMEVGDATESGDPALFEKMPVFWRPKERPPLRRIYRSLIKLRKETPALRSGSVAWLKNTAPDDVVTLMRSDDKDEFVIVINFSNRPVSGTAEVLHAKDFKPVDVSGVPHVLSGVSKFDLNGFEWRIYHRAIPR